MWLDNGMCIESLRSLECVILGWVMPGSGSRLGPDRQRGESVWAPMVVVQLSTSRVDLDCLLGPSWRCLPICLFELRKLTRPHGLTHSL